MEQRKFTQVILTMLACAWIMLMGLCTQPVHASNAPQPPRTATVYLHGYNGWSWSTSDLIASAQKAGWVKDKMVATVNRHGQVHFSGNWPAKQSQCLVQVIFKKNNTFQARQAKWLTNVLKELKTRYHATNYNGVGHSLGCNVLLNEALWYGHKKSIPKLQKLVMIAGPFNGVLWLDDEANKNALNKLGAPAIMNAIYLNLYRMRKQFPRNVEVLNISGNLDNGSNSDQYVSLASSKSLKFLLDGIAKSYKSLEFYGKKAEHSQLHQNTQVLKAINNFLWG